MKLRYHKNFQKQLLKLSDRQQQQITRTLLVLMQDPDYKQLRNHPLKGEWAGYRSISTSGDMRLHFKVISTDTVLFVAVGTHSQLYK